MNWRLVASLECSGACQTGGDSWEDAEDPMSLLVDQELAEDEGTTANQVPTIASLLGEIHGLNAIKKAEKNVENWPPLDDDFEADFYGVVRNLKFGFDSRHAMGHDIGMNFGHGGYGEPRRMPLGLMALSGKREGHEMFSVNSRGMSSHMGSMSNLLNMGSKMMENFGEPFMSDVMNSFGMGSGFGSGSGGSGHGRQPGMGSQKGDQFDFGSSGVRPTSGSQGNSDRRPPSGSASGSASASVGKDHNGSGSDRQPPSGSSSSRFSASASASASGSMGMNRGGSNDMKPDSGNQGSSNNRPSNGPTGRRN